MNIAVASVTWVRTPQERILVLDTLKSLSTLQIPLVLVDSGSSEDDKNAMREIPHVSLFEQDGALTSRLVLAHKEAAKIAEYIFYLQTDKVEFARDTAAQMLTSYEKSNDKGVYIAARTAESIRTYPSYQREVERFLDFFISDYIGKEGDYFAGPKIYPAKLVAYADFLKNEIYWGVEAFFYAIAKRLGMNFAFHSFAMSSPKDIDSEEKTKEYRLKITKGLIEGFLLGKNIPL